MTRTIRAVRIVDGAPRVVDLPRPADTDGWVRIAVRSAGICASDLHLIDSGLPVHATLGHEIAGTTPDGRAVAIEPLVPCGDCAPCRRGDYHLCPGSTLTLIGIGTDGGMADELIVPAAALVPLAGEVPLGDASLVEPLAVAVHGLRLAGHAPGTRLAVIGAGTIGLAATAVAATAGGQVWVAARHDHQRAAAERLGGTVLSDPRDPTVKADVVVETAGTAAALAQAVHLVRPGGVVVLLSIHWQPEVTPGIAMWLKEVTVIASMTYNRGPDGRDIDVAAAILARNPDIARTMITHRLPLDAAADAFAIARDRAAGAIKVVLEP